MHAARAAVSYRYVYWTCHQQAGRKASALFIGTGKNTNRLMLAKDKPWCGNGRASTLGF